MGSRLQPVLKEQSQNIKKSRAVALVASPSTTKISMTKVKPIVVEDDNEDIWSGEEPKICSQKSKQMNEEQYKLMEETIEEEPEAVAIKVRWNSFIKTKKKNYMDDYVIIKQIGRGGFGKVSKVKSKFTGIYRAAKSIKKSKLGSEETQKLFQQMNTMMSLDHPNIAKLFEVYDYKSHYVLILELCEGGQLFKKILVSNHFKESYIAGVIKQIIKALLYLKHKNIVHRDLKPENMLFQKNSQLLKIIDFGIAVEKNGTDYLSERVGTPYYVAPQVLLKKYDERCDLWSTGVIMYIMMTRRPPFKGDNEKEVMQSILSIEPSFPKDVRNSYSAECISFVKGLLTKNPNDRMTLQKAFSHPWLTRETQKLTQSEKNKDIIKQIGQFKFKNKLEAVVHTFIVSQLMTSQEKDIFTQIFEQLDRNNDGVISKVQFEDALRAKSSIPGHRMSLLMRVIDTNGSGYIDLTQFIVAGLKLKDNFTKEHFQQAFAYFDIDHSGFISYDQIAFFLQDPSQSVDSIKKLFKQIDQNSDGVISREQFVHLLMKSTRQKLKVIQNPQKMNI